MEQKQINFKEALAFGEEGEKDVAELLIKKGINILPLYQFTTEEAPKIINQNNNYISPDLTCFFNGKCFFVEVKSKNRWTICPKTKRTETGCDYRRYKHYLELSEKTGLKVLMVFNHINNKPFKHLNESSNGFFYVDVKEKGRYWSGHNEKTNQKIHKPIYFWNYNQLTRI